MLKFIAIRFVTFVILFSPADIGGETLAAARAVWIQKEMPRMCRVKGVYMFHARCCLMVFMGWMALLCAPALNAQDLEKLSEAEKRDFLINGEVIKYTRSDTGITRPYKLTLRFNGHVHNGSFQPVDEYKPYIKFSNGRTEINYRDSYKFNLAAYELAKLLGLGDMMPVTVERHWDRKIGSLTWWLPVMMNEREKIEKNIVSPDIEAWNRQMNKINVFVQLVYDTDRNRTNNLISKDWQLWMIDFTRAFRLHHTLDDPESLTRCDRTLLQKLRELDAVELKENTADWLTGEEVEAVMARRDKIIARFEDLVARLGEKAVLYD